MSKILGIFGGSHNASASFVEDGEIVCCIEEERLKRIKSGNDFGRVPRLACKAIMEKYQLEIDDFDHVAVCAPFCNDFVKSLNPDPKKLTLINHHTCHCYGAYLTSGFVDKTLVISYDGGGDRYFGKIYLAENNKMTLIKSIPLWNAASAGQIYAHTTVNLGWQMLKDEGKVTGLAAHGKYNETIYSQLNNIFFYNGDLSFSYADAPGKASFVLTNLKKTKHLDFLDDPDRRNLKRPEIEYKADIAYNVQLLLEEEMKKFLNDLNSRYPEYKKLVLSGGLFANVKLNQKINELPWVEEVYISPPMGDDGLSLGAALTISCLNGERKTKRLDNVFLGLDYSNEEIEEAIDFEYTKTPYSPEILAKHLHENKIAGWFQGKFEHGPRALGARSILVKVTDPNTHQVLNERLGRHEIMPFAPFVLAEKADEIFHIDKSRMAAEFMTMCYDTKEGWAEKIPAVVHEADGTARPQLVYEERNPKFHSILKAYEEVSGLPILLNTSFNGHGEPIIDSPAQALAHLNSGMIDLLVAEDYIYFKKQNGV